MKNLNDIEGNRWIGGITKELFRDRKDYNIRISCASIDPGESVFSDFTGYKRILKILEGRVELTRDNKVIDLTPKDIFVFGGEEHIKSKNNIEVLDFNVIYKTDICEVSLIEIKDEKDLDIEGKKLILSKSDGVEVEIEDEPQNMTRYDFIITDLTRIKVRGDSIVVIFKKL